MNHFEIVIGIEIHCELKTKSKMFSSSGNDFGFDANTKVNEVDLGYPGTLPVLNKQAVVLAIKAATCLNCEIDDVIMFDRKNYYYSDLAKGYQITQDARPIGKNGFVNIEVNGKIKPIRINRLHMEEDTAKQTHFDTYTLIDYNRSGLPLIEVVTEPDIHSIEEAVAYVDKIRSIFSYAEVSDVKMEEGSMRCDINVSLNPWGSDTYGTRVEIKNMNSLNNIQKALEYEVKRQEKELLLGNSINQETRRYDEATKTTIKMRDKTDAVDYKYFTEPNIIPIKLDKMFIEDVKKTIPKLADERKNIYISEYQLSEYDASVIVSSKSLSDYFDEVVKYTKEYKLAVNWVTQEVTAYLNKNNLNIESFIVEPMKLAKLIELINTNVISSKQAKLVFELMVKDNENPKQIVEKLGMIQITDENEIIKMVNTVLDNNEQSIIDYKNGKDKAIGFLVGQVMKVSKGKANPTLVNKILLAELNKR